MRQLSFLILLSLMANSALANLRKNYGFLAHEINSGFKNEKLHHQLSLNGTTALAINYLKSKRPQFLSYSMGNYFCFRYLTSRTCWQQVQPGQIQFLHQTPVFKVKIKNRSADLATLVELIPTTTTSAWWNPLSSAHAQEIDLEELLADQYQQLEMDQQQLEDECVERARKNQSTKGAIKCGVQYNEDLRRLAGAQKKVINEEYDRLRNAMMIVTQDGLMHINDAKDKAVEAFPFKTAMKSRYKCGEPLRHGPYQVQVTAESRVLKITADKGPSYVATYASTDHTGLNNCELKARDRRFLESCNKPEAIEIRKGLWDSCRFLELSCQPKNYHQVLLVGRCESSDCKSLTPVPEFELEQDLFALQNTMLVAEFLNKCCASKVCLEEEKNLGLELTPNSSISKPRVARPDGGTTPEKGQLPQAER